MQITHSWNREVMRTRGVDLPVLGAPSSGALSVPLTARGGWDAYFRKIKDESASPEFFWKAGKEVQLWMARGTNKAES